MTIAQLVASALAVCPDCHLPIYPGEPTEGHLDIALYHQRCPDFLVGHRPAPREGIVAQLRDARLDWR